MNRALNENSFWSYWESPGSKWLCLKFHACVSGMQPWQLVNDGNGDRQHIRGSFWCRICVMFSESSRTCLFLCHCFFPLLSHQAIRYLIQRVCLIGLCKWRMTFFSSPPPRLSPDFSTDDLYCSSKDSFIYFGFSVLQNKISAEMQRTRGRELHAQSEFSLLFCSQNILLPKKQSTCWTDDSNNICQFLTIVNNCSLELCLDSPP